MSWKIDSVGLFYSCGEGMEVYFDPASGDTHLVSEFAAYLIRQIAGKNRPLDSEELISLIATDIEPADLPELIQAIPDILAELTSLDIVAQA